MKKKSSDHHDFEHLLRDLDENGQVQKMKQYIQHGQVSTYDHCRDVAKTSFQLNRLLHLHADEETLVKGAMLHDFYLYDWHEKDNGTHDWHGFIHAKRAADNARKYTDADEKTLDVIRSHMWPLNLTRLPRSREAWIVCLADKYVSAVETVMKRKH